MNKYFKAFGAGAAFGAVVLSIALIVASCGGPAVRQETAGPPASSGSNADEDKSVAPGMDAEDPAGARSAPFNIRSNTIRTRHVFDGAITAGKLGFKAVTVNVSAAGTTGSSAADPDLAGGILFSCDPSGNQDQHLDNAVLNGDGSITVTLGAAATAQNNFRCVAMKPNAKGIS